MMWRQRPDEDRNEYVLRSGSLLDRLSDAPVENWEKAKRELGGRLRPDRDLLLDGREARRDQLKDLIKGCSNDASLLWRFESGSHKRTPLKA